jgi:hypothetical protein
MIKIYKIEYNRILAIIILFELLKISNFIYLIQKVFHNIINE